MLKAYYAALFEVLLALKEIEYIQMDKDVLPS